MEAVDVALEARDRLANGEWCPNQSQDVDEEGNKRYCIMLMVRKVATGEQNGTNEVSEKVLKTAHSILFPFPDDTHLGLTSIGRWQDHWSVSLDMVVGLLDETARKLKEEA